MNKNLEEKEKQMRNKIKIPVEQIYAGSIEEVYVSVKSNLARVYTVELEVSRATQVNKRRRSFPRVYQWESCRQTGCVFVSRKMSTLKEGKIINDIS